MRWNSRNNLESDNNLNDYRKSFKDAIYIQHAGNGKPFNLEIDNKFINLQGESLRLNLIKSMVKTKNRIKNIIYPSGYVPSTNTVIEFLGIK